MYDRAPRSLTQAAAGTGQSVGPGTYEAPEIGRKKYGEFAFSRVYTKPRNYTPG